MYSYLATLERVVDGDTVDVRVDLGFQLSQTMRLRLRGIDTPEKRGATRALGLLVREFVERELKLAKIIGIRTYKQEKYGRYVTDLFYSKKAIKPENVFQSRYCLNHLLVKKRSAKRAFNIP